MKKLIALAMACLASAAFAATSTHQENADVEGGIVTPAQARGFILSKMFDVDANGDVVICPPGAGRHTRTGKCTNADDQEVPLVPMAKAIPAGKVFVGFRVVAGYSGSRVIEVYYR